MRGGLAPWEGRQTTMSVFDCFTDEWQEGDYLMAESVTIDLSTPAGFDALRQRAHEEIGMRFFADFNDRQEFNQDAYLRLAGRSLQEVADEMAGDLLQESVSLPKGAFADHERAGREMGIIRQVARYVYYQELLAMFRENMGWHGFRFPAGLPTSQPSQQHRQRLPQNHQK